jgi:hypothetical protein
LQADGAALRTETHLENAGAAALDVVIQSRCEADLRTPDLAAVVFRSEAGRPIDKKLIQLEQAPTGSATYDGPARPDGEWKLVGAGSGLVLVNRFLVDEVSRSFVEWTGKTGSSVTMGLWSARRSLAPGGVLTLEASYEIKRER